MNSVVVHYQEISLKGRNRPWFTARLVQNLRTALSDLDVKQVKALMGRLEIVMGPESRWDDVRARVAKVFGIANFSLASGVERDVECMAAAILESLGDRSPSSFRVSVKRSDKQFPLLSHQVEREVGGRIKEARGWRVDLERPDLDVRIEIVPQQAFYFFDKHRGPGGLPVGVSGRVLCLLSGGIDSPVAAYRMMKRGCTVHFVHFHAYPFHTRASIEKAQELATLLTEHQYQSTLHLVAFGELQRQVVLTAPAPLRVVLYRRLMMRIAERLARSWRAKALVTGEVVGQVASQTLENISVISAATSMPILRPLIGMDKEEIVAEGQRIGSYPISIQPDEDCCQLFTPKHPATRSRLGEVEDAERSLPIDELVSKAAAEAEAQEFTFPARAARA